VAQDKKTRRGEGRAEGEAPGTGSTLWQRIADSIYGWEYWLDPEGRYVYVSPSCERVSGYRPDEFLADPDLMTRLVHPDDRALFERHVELVHGPESSREMEIEFRIVARDGEERWIVHHCVPMLENGRYLGRWSSNSDISRYRLAQERLLRLSSELLAVKECVRGVLRAEDEQKLLTDVCRTICNVAGYRMAWIGMVEHDEAKTVRPVAWGGVEDGYLSSAEITWADTERGRGPTGMAARTGETHVIENYASDPAGLPWRARAYQRGYRSSAAVPLRDSDNEVCAVLTVYAAEAQAFARGTVGLLEQLAEDLAFGLRSLRGLNSGSS
jgi:PAS domain S-box-containing protein